VNPKALTEVLGPASISITFDLYGHLLPGTHDEATGLLDALLARSAGADTDTATAAHPAETVPESGLGRNR
jgi:hypothetical protein